MHYVYILQDQLRQDIYIGCTGNLRRRLEEHNKGKSYSTRGKSWSLVYYEAYRSAADAWQREQRLKQHGQAKAQLKRRLKNSLGQS